MSRKTRAVQPETLENQERGMELADRAPAAGQEESAPGAAVAEIRRRIQVLREALPPATQGSCRACFHRGARVTRDAVSVEDGDVLDRIAALQANYPPDPEPHDGRSYKDGVEAVLRAITE